MSVSVSILAGAALKATLSAKFTDHVSAKLDLKDFFGMFKSGKSNDAAIKDTLGEISDKLDAVQTGIDDLGDQMDAVGGLVEHSISVTYSSLIRGINSDAASYMQTLVTANDPSQTSKEQLLSDSNALLNDAMAEVSALAADPHTSAELLAVSAFSTLTNAIATRVAVVKKYSDQGLGYDAISGQLDAAADLLEDIYRLSGSGDLYQKVAEQVVTTVTAYHGYSTAIFVVESIGPGGTSATRIVAESQYFNVGSVIPSHYGAIAGQTVTMTSSDPEAAAYGLADPDGHPATIAQAFVQGIRSELDPVSAIVDVRDLLRGDSIVLGSADDDASGTVHADYMHGGDGDDELSGDRGSDVIHGGEGMDDINGGRGHDVIYGGLNRDTVHAGRGDDIVEGGDGRDRIEGGKGHDILYQSSAALSGGAADQNEGGVIFGDQGNDDIYGDDGADNLDGGLGNDLILGRGGADVILGGAGDDNLFGEDGDDNLSGGSGDDMVEGGDGNDILDGGFGDDVLIGGAGWNLIFGGAGDDVALIDGTITQFDFAQLEDGTLAVFGAPGHAMPVYFIAKREGSIFDDGVETLQFDDVAITNHWNAGGPPSGFKDVPKPAETPFLHTDTFVFEKARVDLGLHTGLPYDLRASEPEEIGREPDGENSDRLDATHDDAAGIMTFDEYVF